MKISDALLSDLKSLVSSVEVELKPVVLLAHVTWLRDVADKLEKEVSDAELPDAGRSAILASEVKPEPTAEVSGWKPIETSLANFFERWRVIADAEWSSGDYTKTSLGSRADTILKELREVIKWPPLPPSH